MINLRVLNSDGITKLTYWLESESNPQLLKILLHDDSCTEILDNFLIDETKQFDSRLHFGQYLNDVLSGFDLHQLLSSKYDGLWAWISLLYFDQLTSKGIRRKEHYIVVRKGSAGSLAYRNAPRTSYELYNIHRENSRICLSGQMSTFGDLTEQLASRQSISHNRGFFNTASDLYIRNGKLVSGASSKPKALKLRQPSDRSGLGSVRRLALALQRLDLTYDTDSMGPIEIKQVLPKEFNKFSSSD